MRSAADIVAKRDSLYSMAPFSDGVKLLKRRTDLVDFAYSDLRLYGSSLSRSGVESILDGIGVPSAPVFEHRLCDAHRRLLDLFYDKLDMSFDVDSIVLNEFCGALSGETKPRYRSGAPVIYQLDFVPCDDGRISYELEDMFARVRRDEKRAAYSNAASGTDFCFRAAAIHTGIVRVYPYKNGFSELAARAAMQYELISAGYFPVDIGVDESEYNVVTAAAIKTGNHSEFAALLRTAVYNKLCFLSDVVERGVYYPGNKQ